MAMIRAGDLRPGLLVDLENDAYADNGQHPEFEFAFETVATKLLEGPDCVLIEFESGFACGFPPDHELLAFVGMP